MTGVLKQAQPHLDFIIPPDTAGAPPPATHTHTASECRRRTLAQTQLPVCIHSVGGVTEYADSQTHTLPAERSLTLSLTLWGRATWTCRYANVVTVNIQHQNRAVIGLLGTLVLSL